MRIYIFLLLMLFYSQTALSSVVSIRTVIHDGLKTYELDAAAFPKESSALQLKLKLSSLLNQPVSIEALKDRQLYLVKIGPIKELEDAKKIQAQLEQENIGSVVSKENEPSTPEPFQQIGKLWNLNNADIRAVIAEVSRITGKNFIIDPRVQGKISIIATKPLSNEALYQVFLSMLQVSGYAAVPLGDVVKIIPNMDAKSASFEYAKNATGDAILVQVIPVLNVPAEQLIPVLRPLMPQWASISAYAPSNMLILSGRAANIKRMASIIKQVDSSSVNGVDMIHLQHTLAMDVVATLKDLVKAPTTAGGGTSTSHQINIAADDRSNSILLSGSKTERIRYRLLISQLDKRSAYESDSNTQVVYLSYLRAEDLVPILAGIAQANFSGNVGTTIGTITVPALDSTNPQSSQINFNSGSGTNEQPASNNSATPATPNGAPNSTASLSNTQGAANQNEGSTKPTVQIIAEPNTNSVILNAPVAVIRILKSVIRQLDIRPAQLLIEALVAEVDETDLSALGIEWGSTSLPDRNTSFRPGFVKVNSKTSINDFQAQIYALETNNKANILSTPSVMVLDNRQAKILVGQQVSVSSSSYPNNANGTAPSGSPYTTFQRVNVALHLYVRPQITHGRGINLQIDQGNDTIVPTAGAAVSTTPVFNISAIVTSIHVESGDVIILGGLIQNEVDKSGTDLPILNNIPGIGRLFQHNVNTHRKRVLLVFIKPSILRTEQDEMIVSGAKYNDVRQTELSQLRPEIFDERDRLTVLPPLDTAQLPKPFTHLTHRSVVKTKERIS